MGDYGNSYTNYGAQGGNDGGGFMPGTQDSPSTKRQYARDTLRPVTIKQILNAEHPSTDTETFLIDGVETSQVTFVGQIRNISKQTTNVTYKIDDGTGTFEVKIWIDSETADLDDKNSMHGRLVDDAYARVWGNLKSFNGKRHVAGKQIKPVTDMNEINYHLLEATFVHLETTQGPVAALKKTANGGNKNGNAAAANGSSTDRLPPNATSNAKKVFQCILASQKTNEGLHMQDIAMQTGIEVSDVLKAGDELSGLGAIYTTVDDHTWALLEV